LSQKTWTAVDEYILEHFIRSDELMAQVLENSDRAGLPLISVSPAQGKFLNLLAKLVGAKKILEIGTLGGYSTIWMGRALPANGELITIEFLPEHAAVARANIALASLEKMINVRVGRAIEELPKIEKEGIGPFDLVFIDADKESTPEYFDWALKLTRKGSLIVVDNVVRNGLILDKDIDDVNVQGVRRFYEKLAKEPRVDATALQTVGLKGYDGMAIAQVIAAP
jgi:predicted O-methyltransferase YrrM